MATEEKLKEEQLKEIIREKRGGRWIEYHGPYKIGSSNVWEIWTFTNQSKKDKANWTPQTRWWLEEENGSKLYFPYFSDLAPYLNNQTEAFKLKRFSLYVAGIAFIVALGTVSYLFVTGKATSDEALTLALVGAVASGGGFFFGRWLLPGTSDGTTAQP